MFYAQHLRILRRAGGHVSTTPRAYIRAAHKLLSAKGRTREARELRHQWLREGLAYLRADLRTFHHVTRGF